MKKKYFIIIIILIVLIGVAIYLFYKNSNKNIQNNSTYNTSKLEYIDNSENTNNMNNINSSNSENQSDQNINTQENNTNTSTTSPENTESNNIENNNSKNNPSKETEIASFSTKIYTKDNERQNNISITCSTLNNTIVKSGNTFSFCNTVGKATSSKGYQKADVFNDGKVVKALGGGNCQISTTLYNAVLKVPELNVTERHSHSNSVPYIKSGKDAAVAYGSYDFKFVNNTRKIY